MRKLMQVEGIKTKTKARPCAQCGEPAGFYSPTGFLCEEDALEDAALNMWIPRMIDHSSSNDTPEPADSERTVSTAVGDVSRNRGF